ncbi:MULTISPECIES: glycosyltransferase family 2 protein [Actibacterium]|uniref:Glycosyltransferase involved in cell wall biosynthesis n=1 Tax=Actibacterium naphthalenivorans TaxID=1614693 RepID=A0A840C706_9RHOB|nr:MULTISPECIES: glycosyltransferase family 2 protein [Actibacterium]ALG91636.1 hypothetical protein TQ29_17355 [Actibacterium sp. EMB200-NS6]MBB4021731.1 glycosyltransferase involved in cell wall biosynthesis [Actibacterium naphthalenivorans]
MTKLTCITTTFNDGKALYNSVNSILNQSYENFQYIIVDDGSSDETRDIVSSIKDERVQVIMQANDGVSGARNKGMEHIAGSYVCFLDSDDTRPNWAFQAMVDVVEREDPDLLLCRGTLSELRGDLFPFYDDRVFEIIRNSIGTQPAVQGDPGTQAALRLSQLVEPQPANKLIRTSLIKRNRIEFPNTHFFEDIFFHSNVLARAQKVSFLHTSCFSYFRRYVRPQTTSSSSDLRFDIIPVTKLTLETFEKLPQFHDPYHRAAVVASCFKILEWCEQSISLHYRYHFREAARALLTLINPLFLHFPHDTPDGMEVIRSAEKYIGGLSHA